MLIQVIDSGDIYNVVLSWREMNVKWYIYFVDNLQIVIFKNFLSYSTEAAQSYGDFCWKSVLFSGTCEWAQMMFWLSGVGV